MLQVPLHQVPSNKVPSHEIQSHAVKYRRTKYRRTKYPRTGYSRTKYPCTKYPRSKDSTPRIPARALVPTRCTVVSTLVEVTHMARSFHFDGAGYLTRSDTYHLRQHGAPSPFDFQFSSVIRTLWSKPSSRCRWGASPVFAFRWKG